MELHPNDLNRFENEGGRSVEPAQPDAFVLAQIARQISEGVQGSPYHYYNPSLTWQGPQGAIGPPGSHSPSGSQGPWGPQGPQGWQPWKQTPEPRPVSQSIWDKLKSLWQNVMKGSLWTSRR